MLMPITTWVMLFKEVLDEAIDVYNKSILKPDYADTYNNLGKALQDQGKLMRP